jgi:hypothetical protein
LRALGRVEDAENSYRAALELNPGLPEALISLGGLIASERGQFSEALTYYDEALRQSPHHATAWINRAGAFLALDRVEDAENSYRIALEQNPGHPEVLHELGCMAQRKSHLDEALVFFDQALAVRPGFYKANFGKSLALLSSGEYGEGWWLYETGLNRRDLRGLSPFKSKAWDGTPVKRLLIWSEQGYGDSLQFVRYAALCRQRAEKVIVVCHKPLIRLFRSSPYIDEVYDRVEEAQFDAQVSMMSLPHLFGTTLETVPANVPYLATTPDIQMRWRECIASGSAGRSKVGIVWAGGTHEDNVRAKLADRRRSVCLEAFRGLLDVPEVQFFSLQTGAASGWRTWQAGLDSVPFRCRLALVEKSAR